MNEQAHKVILWLTILLGFGLILRMIVESIRFHS